MSYEGFSQKLCKRGHLALIDCHDSQVICPVCCSPFVWSNDVDETNGEAVGLIDLEPYLRKPSRIITTETEDGWVTGHRHAEYNIPPSEEDELVEAGMQMLIDGLKHNHDGFVLPPQEDIEKAIQFLGSKGYTIHRSSVKTKHNVNSPEVRKAIDIISKVGLVANKAKLL